MTKFLSILTLIFVFGLSAEDKKTTDSLKKTLPKEGQLENGKAVGPGWVSLLNNLDAWNTDSKYWTLKDGVLYGKYEGGKPHQHMWTKKKYKDFEMHAVFKMTGKNTNSGVCARLNPKNADYAPGYQFDMGDGYWGCLWEDRRDRMVHKFPKELAQKLVNFDDWNHYYAIVKGHHIQAWLNGVKTIDVVHKKGFLEGSFGFQLAHGKRHTELTVKTFLLKELNQ
jgi:hypothetical protein